MHHILIRSALFLIFCLDALCSKGYVSVYQLNPRGGQFHDSPNTAGMEKPAPEYSWTTTFGTNGHLL